MNEFKEWSKEKTEEESKKILLAYRDEGIFSLDAVNKFKEDHHDLYWDAVKRYKLSLERLYRRAKKEELETPMITTSVEEGNG